MSVFPIEIINDALRGSEARGILCKMSVTSRQAALDAILSEYKNLRQEKEAKYRYMNQQREQRQSGYGGYQQNNRQSFGSPGGYSRNRPSGGHYGASGPQYGNPNSFGQAYTPPNSNMYSHPSHG
jgi:hypothetical protein